MNSFLLKFFLISSSTLLYGGFGGEGKIVEDFISSEAGMKFEVLLDCPAYLHSDKRTEQLRLLLPQLDGRISMVLSAYGS